MRTQLLDYLACPNCEMETPFDVQANASQDDGDIVSGTLTCQSCQCVYQIRDGIPRFVSLDQDYCSNFGFQWKRWRTLQIDRLSGHSLSTDRFFADSEWPPSSLEGKVVLDAGCGAGRFADVAAAHGATVIAVDLSDAIDACPAARRGVGDARQARSCTTSRCGPCPTSSPRCCRAARG